VHFQTMVIKEAQISASRVTLGEFPRALRLMSKGLLHPELLVTDRMALRDITEAFAKVDRDDPGTIKAVLRRPQNRLGAAHDDRLEAWLRADRVNILRLAAALQLDASLALTAVDPVGWHVLDAERAIDLLHALREDFARSGPVPWPIAVNEPWDGVDGREAPRSADWPAVSAFVRGWYSAAAARLQALVELRLLPALIARGLGLFPDDPDLLLARGSFVETRLALARVDASLAAIVYPSDVRQRWRGELAEAERDYERAANAAGATREAAVRLARVRLLKEDAARARELLGGVLAAETSGELRYLALLLRAAAAEQAGDRESAARDYEAAAAAFPGGQTALLALARVADERNLPADAFRTNNPMRWAKRYLAQLQQAA
jgi:hypothetical protein